MASDILADNAARTKELHSPYDPVTGEGSLIEREDIYITPGGEKWGFPRTIHDPTIRAAVDAIKEAGSASALFPDVSEEDLKIQLSGLRVRCDFEFYCSVACHIKLDAETRARVGTPIATLKLNKAQLKYSAIVWQQFVANVPIRIALLKARQWGGSTMTEAFFSWLMLYQRAYWNMFVCCISIDQARHIREMLLDTMASHLPPQYGAMTFRPYAGSARGVTKVCNETGSIIGISSIERPDSVRSYSIHMAHLSEVGLWPSTPHVNADDYAQAVAGAVPDEPMTCIIQESTAKGVGTYFHEIWQQAEGGESVYKPVFIPWFSIPKYELTLDDDEAMAFYASMDEYETWLWGQGCTVGQIAWYRNRLSTMKGDRTRMMSEFPSTPQEAFQSTGQAYFSLDVRARMRKRVAKPKRKCAIKGKAAEGVDAFKDVRLVDAPNGEIYIWRAPDAKVMYGNRCISHGDDGEPKKWVNRYAAFADFGGKTDRADYSVCTIIDRIRMTVGGPVEVVARLRCHLRPDLFAWRATQLAQLYDECLLAFEINRMQRDRGDDRRGYEPEWSLAAIEEVRNIYPNLYLRASQSRIDEAISFEIGFHTNMSTKPMILNTLDEVLEEDLLVEPDARAINELDTFEKRTDGSLGAVAGNHDDIVITLAGATWLATKEMDPIVERKRRAKRKKPVTAAAI